MTDAPLERRKFDRARGGLRWVILGPDGAVDFHCDDPLSHDPIAGLECHYRRRPTYMKPDAEPFTEKCWATGARCWGDGTSLYATERLLPEYQWMLRHPDHAQALEDWWTLLEREYERRFSPLEIAFVAEPEASHG